MKKLLSVLLTLVMLVPAFGSFPVIASTGSAVAQVIDSNGYATDYSTFEAAWKAAVGGKTTFKLLSDWSGNGKFGASEASLDSSLYFNGGALSVPSGYTVTIDLNGHTINRSKGVNQITNDGSVIRLFDGASITINDTSESKNGSIEGGSSNYGGGIYAPSNNTVTMNGGKIRLCNGYYGGGVYLDSNSKFIMNGGRIEHNTGYYGGGVYTEDDAVFETHGGEISENRATADGGGIYLWSAIAKLDKCIVSANKAKNGGAIYSDYSVVKNYSSLTIDNTKILNNTADNYYGGIYHCAGGFALLGNTRITGNRNEGNFGGGVYSQKVPIYLAGNVQVYGNYSQGDLRQPCDVNFGKSLNEAFILKGYMEQDAMIGVYTTVPTTPVDWCRSYHLYRYGNCPYTDDNMKSLADCLFLNKEAGANGFSYSEKIDSHSQDRTWHDTRVNRGDSTVKSDVKVTQVRYKGVILSPSEYSSDYNAGSRTITLNVPDYVTDTNRLTVYANKKNSDNRLDPGKEISFSDGFDISDKQALIITTVNKSPDYTVTVYGGTVDGKTSTTKKYFEPFSIAPIVPEGKVFSHWEIEGDNADDIPGFEKYAKSPAKLEMPQHDVTFKAVFKEKVSKIDIKLYEPRCKDLIASYTTANITYTTANGVEMTESVDVKWRKHITDRTQDKFDYNTIYDASLSLSDGSPADFGFADANELKIYLNGKELSKENYRYVYQLEKIVEVGGEIQASDSVKQHWVYITYPYRTDKAKVLTVESPTIEIPSDISIEELNKLLPDSVNITYESIDGEKTASAPVLWNTASLSETIQDNAEINGTVTIPETLEATEEQKQTTITVKVTSDKQRLDKPSASVKEDAIIGLDEKITLSAKDGATIWYKIDDDAFVQYNQENGIVPKGEAGKITDHTITAYCTKDGFLQSPFLTLNIKVDNQSVHTVKIIDKNGTIYGYASGAGEYKAGENVTIEATESDPEKFVSSWSAEGITLDDTKKTAAKFTFPMPPNDVTITVESFRYYVSKLYLSSITPIADNPLPQTLEIIGAEDINGNVIENVPLKIELMEWHEKNAKTPITDKDYRPELGKTYTAVLQIKPNDEKVREVCDDFKVFVDDKEYSPYPFLLVSHTYLFDWDFTAVYDELKSVNLGDSITAYTGNYIDFPEKIGVKTKYGSIATAKVTWTGTEKVDTSKVGTYNVTATLTLPNNVEDTNNLATKDVTINVRDIINSVKLTTTTDIPVKSGNPLPTEVTVASNGARFVENSFSVSTNDGTAVSDDAVSGTEYTIKARVAPAENCEFAANTIFTINGISMNASPAENGEYELTYTFTAQDVQSYDVIVNGGESQAHNEGDRVEISTSADGFYKWTAETVYETTETVIGDNNEQKEITVTHRNPVNIFTDGNEYKAKTSFVMPKLADGSRLELTAEYVGINYNEKTKCATIISDKDYTGIKIIFAAYSNGELALVKWVDADLAEGFNTVTAPKAFSITGADTIKVMVWENFDNMKPLFEDFEKQITGDEIK